MVLRLSRVRWRRHAVGGVFGLLAACASPSAVSHSPEAQQFPAIGFGIGALDSLVLQVGGYTGHIEADSVSGSADGFTVALGGEMNAYLDLLGRVTSGDTSGSGAMTGNGAEPDASNLFLDLVLQAHIPVREDFRVYVAGFYGYGFLDPDRRDLDTSDGRSWGLGAGVEYVMHPAVTLSSGLEYRDTAWGFDFASDYDQYDLTLQFALTLRMP